MSNNGLKIAKIEHFYKYVNGEAVEIDEAEYNELLAKGAHEYIVDDGETVEQAMGIDSDDYDD